MIDPFVLRFFVAVGLYFFGDLFIRKFVRNADAKNIFEVILLLACVLYLFFGGFLPFR